MLENEPLHSKLSIVANDASILLNVSQALASVRRRHIIHWKQVNANDMTKILAFYNEKLIGEDILITRRGKANFPMRQQQIASS